MNQQKMAALIVAYTILKRRKLARESAIHSIADKYRPTKATKTKEQKRKTRRCWVRTWLQKRSEYGTSKNLLKQLKIEDAQQYRSFLSMSAVQVESLIQVIGPLISKKDTNMRQAIPVLDRVLLTLRFLASGSSYTSLQHAFRMPVNTIGRIVKEVTEAICTILNERYVMFENTPENWLQQAEDFQRLWNFPHCLGAIDGRHVVMKTTHNSETPYYNYNGSHTIVLLAIVDANYKFTFLDVECDGTLSEDGTYVNSTLSDDLDQGTFDLPDPSPLPGRNIPVPYCFVADEELPMKTNILKPYSSDVQSVSNQVFNSRLSRAHGVAENAFGIIANKFQVLRKPINLQPDRVKNVVLAICTLHNFLLSTEDSRDEYLCPGLVDSEDSLSNTIIPGDWRNDLTDNGFLPLQRDNERNCTSLEIDVRDEFKEFFLTTPLGVKLEGGTLRRLLLA